MLGWPTIEARILRRTICTIDDSSFGTLPVAISSHAQESLFSISLAQWSLNRRLFGGDLDPLDFPAFAESNFGIRAVEYVNQFFMDKAQDQS